MTCEVDVGGVRLAYQVSGPTDAPPMVLLHGLGSDASSWDPVVAAFAERWRVYAPDQRGHGRSDRPGTYSFELLATDLIGFLDALELRRAVVVGHSMGGVAAYLCAHDHPDRVAALVLAETPPPVPHRRPLPDRPAEPTSYDWAARHAIITQVNGPDPAWWDKLAAVPAPTLVVAGGPESPFPRIPAMAEQLPRGELVTIPVGHRVHHGDPAAFVGAVVAFLDRHPTALAG